MLTVTPGFQAIHNDVTKKEVANGHMKEATKMIDIFKKPIDKVEYLHSTKFATDLLQICGRVRKVFEDEPRCLSLPSPCYVLGDIHGNII